MCTQERSQKDTYNNTTEKDKLPKSTSQSKRSILNTLNVSPLSKPKHTNIFTIRQSLISDYKTCPKMAYYGWVLKLQETTSFIAAILGSAGHELLRHIHEYKEFSYDLKQLRSKFKEQVDKEVNTVNMEGLELPASGLNKLKDEIDNYSLLLYNYCQDERHRDFSTIINEQSFVLQAKYKEQKIIFTGTIDQAGYYVSRNTFNLRDFKFRDNAYRPHVSILPINIQLALYSLALRYGHPSCKSCEPKIDDSVENQKLDISKGKFTNQTELTYNGPCEECNSLIGTKSWPMLLPEESQIIWMKSYEKRKRDQYQKYIKDKTRKVVNPATGRRVYPNAINPKWETGNKKGDLIGEPVIGISFNKQTLKNLMPEICEIAIAIKNGIFYRSEGSHCINWCQFRQQCIDDLTN